MSDSRQIALRNERPLKMVNVDEIAHEASRVTEEDLYNVQGKKGIGAKVARHIADSQSIETGLVDFGKDKEQAWARVWAQRVGADGNMIRRERGVIMRYEENLRLMIFDAIDKGLYIPDGYDREKRKPKYRKIMPEWTIGEGGWPVITDTQCMMRIMQNHLRKITFAERDAITKAERNAILAVMGDPEEQERGEGAPGEEREEKNLSVGDLRKEIVQGMMDYCGDKESAMQMMWDITTALADKGIKAVNTPSLIDDAGHLKLVLASFRKLQAAQEAAAAEPVEEHEEAL